jgi:hypothetical protein
MIQTLIPQIAPILGNVLDRFFPDKEKAAQAQRAIESALLENAAQINLAQIEVNKVEAASRSVWTSGWRPCVGWVCAAALGYTYVLQPLLVFILAQTGHLVEMPELDIGGLMPILMGMLGLGGLRTFEKMKGLTQ